MEPRIVSADNISVAEYWKQFLKYKSLVWVFALQEINAQFASTFFGLLWIVLRPLAILSIFTLLFHYLLKIHTSTPYYLFAFTGMLAWNFFFQIVSLASPVIIQRQDLIRRMYFPKIILPLSKVIVAGAETLVSFIILFVLMLYARQHVSWAMLTLPVFIFLNICTAFMIALWMNVLNIRYRDLNQILMPVLSIGIWFTPVFFPVTIIPSEYQYLLYFNPMAGVIAGYRYALLGEQFPLVSFWVCFAVVVMLTFAAIRYLIYLESEMVDNI